MNKLKKIFRLLTDENYRFNVLANYGFFNHWPDEKFLKRKFKAVFGYELNLDNPQTFNEKLQWLKLYDRKPIYTTMVDKYEAKKYVASIIGEQYIIPTLGVWDSPDEIDFDKLPNQFVLKCNHNSGLGMCICKDKSKLDIEKVKRELAKGLKQDYYLTNREWPYKDVPRKIIAEKYMEDTQQQELRDYKFFCFNGRVDNVMVCVDRLKGEPKFYFFNEKWELLRLNKRGKAAPADFTLEKPPHINKMFDLASVLSKKISFARVDFYNCNQQIYFGEMTFFPQSGLDVNLLRETDIYLGNLLMLPCLQER